MKTKKITLLVLIIMLLQVAIKSETINVPQDQPTIQFAISMASPADTIIIDTGEYFENLLLIDKNLIIGSKFLTSGDTAYIEQTIINGGNSGRVLKIENVTTPTKICGLTLINGKSDKGAGIYAEYSFVELEHIRIRDCHSHASNSALSAGAAISAFFSNIVVDEFVMESNVATCEGANSWGGALYSFNSDVYLSNGYVRNNASDLGGGIFQQECTTEINNVHFDDNFAGYPGGAIACFGGERMEVVNSVFTSNDGWGSVIYADDTPDVHFLNCLFTGNHGILMHVEDLLLSLVNCTFADNPGSYTVWTWTSCTMYAMNTFFTNNFEHELAFSGESQAYIGYCAISNGEEGIEGNVSLDLFGPVWEEYPLFASDSSYRLSDYSTYIGAGLDSLESFPFLKAPYVDIEGNPRPSPVGSMPDPGAYENELGNPLNIHESNNIRSLVFPNPATEKFSILSSMFLHKECIVQLFDLKGKKLKEISVPPGSQQVIVDAKGWQKGLYLVRVYADDVISEETKVVLK